MYKTLKRLSLQMDIRIAYRKKLQNLKKRMRRLQKDQRRVDALMLKWEDKANTATVLADKAVQESQHVWTKLQNIVHDITMIGSAPRNAEDARATIRKHVETTRKELMN